MLCKKYEKKHVHKISSQGKKISQSVTSYEDTIKITEQQYPDSVVFLLRHPRDKPVEYDPLSEASSYPTLMVLEGEDGGINHAIATVGKWVFDSNLDTAQPLTRDICWTGVCLVTDMKHSLRESIGQLHYLTSLQFLDQFGPKTYPQPFTIPLLCSCI